MCDSPEHKETERKGKGVESHNDGGNLGVWCFAGTEGNLETKERAAIPESFGIAVFYRYFYGPFISFSMQIRKAASSDIFCYDLGCRLPFAGVNPEKKRLTICGGTGIIIE